MIVHAEHTFCDCIFWNSFRILDPNLFNRYPWAALFNEIAMIHFIGYIITSLGYYVPESSK
jgi:hypothetical protein